MCSERMAQGKFPYQANVQKSTASFIQPQSKGKCKSAPARTRSIWTLNVLLPSTDRHSNSKARVSEGIQETIHAKKNTIGWPEVKYKYKRTLEFQLPPNPCHTSALWSTGTQYL